MRSNDKYFLARRKSTRLFNRAPFLVRRFTVDVSDVERDHLLFFHRINLVRFPHRIGRKSTKPAVFHRGRRYYHSVAHNAKTRR